LVLTDRSTPPHLVVPSEVIELPPPAMYGPDAEQTVYPNTISAEQLIIYSDVTQVFVNQHAIPPMYRPITIRGPNNKTYKVFVLIDTGATSSYCNTAFVSLLGCSTRSLPANVVLASTSVLVPTVVTKEHVTV
jgi:hypothetical protein